MKKYIIILSLISATIGAAAQNTDDALRLSLQRPSGTARSISLGNAMGALGGDYTSIGINPAGIAVYRSSEFTFTPSLHLNQTESNYYNTNTTDDRLYMPLQQIGFVGTYKPMHESSSGLVSTHFSVGYTRNNSFKKSTFIQGSGIQSSLLDDFVNQANQGNWDNNYNGLALDAGLINSNPYYREIQDNFPDEYVSKYMSNYEWNYLNDESFHDESGNLIYSKAIPQWGPISGINQVRSIQETGNEGEFNLTFGANFSNKFYLGGALGISTYFSKRETQHYEEINKGKFNYIDFPEVFDGYYESRYHEASIGNEEWFGLNNFTFSEIVNTNGIGINLKVGVIYKPINSLRIGAAIHTPSFYSFDEEYKTTINADQFKIDFIPNDESVYDDLDLTDLNIYEKTNYSEYSYNFRTPYKAIGSLAYTFGTKGLISADYEFTDYNSMKFSSSENTISDMNFINDQNDQIKEVFRGTHNIRLGAEFRPTEIITVRAGYGLFQSPYKKGYINHDDKHQTFSAGLGFKMNNMFIDVGYMLRQQKNLYSLYYSPWVADEDQEPASITSNLHQVAITLGWRF